MPEIRDIKDTIGDEMSYTNLYDFFYFSDADKQNPKKVDMLKDVYDWMAEEASKNKTTPVRECIKLDQKLGEPEIGVTKLEQVWQYIQILKRIPEEVKDNLEAMEK